MSTELESSAKGVYLTRFRRFSQNGEMCVQVTVSHGNIDSFIHLTREQAQNLWRDLHAFGYSREVEKEG
jgi:hypothetical protein